MSNLQITKIESGQSFRGAFWHQKYKWQISYLLQDCPQGPSWPCYMLGGAIIITATPFISMFLAMLLVAIPAIYLAIKINAKQEEDLHHTGYEMVDEIYRDIKRRERQRVRTTKKAAVQMRRQECVSKYEEAKKSETVMTRVARGSAVVSV